jgi:hypothetical protein
MARLTDLTSKFITMTTGLPGSPGQLGSAFVNDIRVPFDQVSDALNPKKITNDIIAGLGFGAIIPVISKGFQSFIDSTKRTTDQFDVVKNNTKKLNDSLQKSNAAVNENLIKIKSVLDDLYEYFTTESAADIEKRREEDAKARGGRSGAPAGSGNERDDPGLEFRPGIFFGFGDILRSMTGIVGKFLKFAGPLAALSLVFSVLKAEDLEKYVANISKGIDKIKNGDWLVGGVDIVGTLGEAITTGSANLVEAIAVQFGWADAGSKWAENFQTKMGEWFGEENSAIWNSFSGAALFMLTKRSTWATALKGLKFLGLARTLSLGVAGAAVYFGEDIQGWMEKQGVPEDWAEISTTAMQGAALGSIFGPKGMLVGAVAGLLYGMGEKAVSWLQGRRDKMMSEQFDNIGTVKIKQIDDAYKLNDEDNAALNMAEAEIDRFATLAVSKEARENALRQKEDIQRIREENERRTGLIDSGASKQRAVSAIEAGDQEGAINGVIDNTLARSNLDLNDPAAYDFILDQLEQFNPNMDWNEELVKKILLDRRLSNPSIDVNSLQPQSSLGSTDLMNAISDEDSVAQANAWVPKLGTVKTTSSTTSPRVSDGLAARMGAAAAGFRDIDTLEPLSRPLPELRSMQNEQPQTVIGAVNVNSNNTSTSGGGGETRAGNSTGETRPQESATQRLIDYQMGLGFMGIP